MKRKTNYQIVTQGQRFETGVIATLSDGISRHFTGNGAEATRAVADYCDQRGLKVLCLSNPGTVYRDLQGWRRNDRPSNRKRITAEEHVDDKLQLPESRMLGAIGRADLIAR